MAQVDADCNLLFGVLALQMDFITREQLIAAVGAWARDKGTPLGEVLIAQGVLALRDRELLDSMVARHVELHGGDPARSLATSLDGRSHAALAAVDDPALRGTLDAAGPPIGHTLISTIGYTPEMRERYTLTRLHAKGGIGQVWLARDAAIGREVALKELRPERSGFPAATARFLEEARVTGQLEHPNIVPVHELAPSTDGRPPFYTMRFVRGRTLAEAIAEYHRHLAKGAAGPLEFQALLNAFVAVCHAVAYAHSRGVIHRDLKPQNVVLGDFGEVVVLDWGLAKLVDRPEDTPAPPVILAHEEGRGETVAGQAMGTPAYMAPEQAEGRVDLVGPSSDIYGLGAILYEILAGRPPFRGDDTAALLRRVILESPERPQAVCPSAPRALEAVCLKALAKKPADRYATAEDLEREVRRYLADEPVTAYREPWGTRARRWVSRNRVLVAGAASALVFALAGMAGVLIVQTQANRELQIHLESEKAAREKADQRLQFATKAVEAFYSGASEDVMLRRPELAELRTRMLKTALEFYRQWQSAVDADPRSDRSETHMLTLMLERIAEIQSQIGAREEALKAYQKALEFWEGPLKENERNHGKALIKMGRLQRQLGRPAEALKSFRRGVDVFEASLKRDPNIRGDLAWGLLNLGSLQQEQGQPEEALRSLERSRVFGEEQVRRQPASLSLWIEQDIAAAHTAIGNILFRSGREDEALRHHEQARSILERISAEKPDNAEYRSDLARSYNNLGYDLTEAGRTPEALAMLERGRKIREELFVAVPLDMSYRSDLARSYYYRARLRSRTGPRDDALADVRRAEDLMAGIPVIVPEDLFHRACLSSLRATQAVPHSGSPTAEEEAERRRLADAAMQTLRRAVDGGFRDRSAIAHEPDLEPLRSRPDFRDLLHTLDQTPR